MYTLQQMLNPLVLQDAGSWIISCPGQPCAVEEPTFERAVEAMIGELRVYSGVWPSLWEGAEDHPHDRVVKLLRSINDESLRSFLLKAAEDYPTAPGELEPPATTQ